MATAEKTGIVGRLPQISPEELLSFQNSHFSDGAVAHFGEDFTDIHRAQHQPLQEPLTEEWEDGDDLGYYPDGVKRTLTDEQIEIFRHSELEALRRKQEKSASKAEPAVSASEVDDDEDDGESSSHPNPHVKTAKKKKKKKKAVKRQTMEPKPDLRKRTWDVVEAGLDTLDYD